MMEILQYHGKGKHLITIEWYYIYPEFTKNNHLNDEHNLFSNKIFDVLLNPQPHSLPLDKTLLFQEFIPLALHTSTHHSSEHYEILTDKYSTK